VPIQVASVNQWPEWGKSGGDAPNFNAC